MQTVKCRNPLGKCRTLVKMHIPTEQSWVGHGSLYLYPGDCTAGLWASKTSHCSASTSKSGN